MSGAHAFKSPSCAGPQEVVLEHRQYSPAHRLAGRQAQAAPTFPQSPSCAGPQHGADDGHWTLSVHAWPHCLFPRPSSTHTVPSAQQVPPHGFMHALVSAAASGTTLLSLVEMPASVERPSASSVVPPSAPPLASPSWVTPPSGSAASLAPGARPESPVPSLSGPPPPQAAPAMAATRARKPERSTLKVAFPLSRTQ
jgi:hypothetical protein